MSSPLTRDSLAANAYRTLGLPASATQAAVDAAARRMRIWPDPSRVPPTAWDLPWLGPIGRAKTDVENAVAKLADPAQRVVERTLWYHGSVPPPDPAAAAALGGTDGAVGSLHAAVVADPAAADVDRWVAVLARWAAVARSPDELVRAEADAGFEKRASDAEVRSAVAAVPAHLADAMAQRARAALDAGDADQCHALVAAVRDAGHARSVDDLLDRLEDAIWSRCEQIDRDLRAVLRTNHDNPVPFFMKNRPATFKAVSAYNATVNPALTAFCGLVGDGDPYRLVRVRSKCGELLVLVAVGWEWSGNLPTAAGTLELAAGLAAGSPLAARVAAELGRVRDRIARPYRPSAVRPPPPKRSAWSGVGSSRWGLTALAVAVSAVVRMLVMSSSNSSSSSDNAPAVPDLNWMSRATQRSARPPPPRVDPLGRPIGEVNRGR